jgi:hypothetical protein
MHGTFSPSAADRARLKRRTALASAGLYEQDGGLLFADGLQPWPDAVLLVQMFWLYYAPLIAESYHGRALRELRAATPHGMKTFANKGEFAACMKATLGPLVKKHRVSNAAARDECAWCTRPGVNVGEQCQGCGAWRRA